MVGVIREGSKVTYIGDDTIVGVGAEGLVLSSSSDYVHLKWSSGGRLSNVDIIPVDDLVPSRPQKQAADSPGLVEAREAYEVMGVTGALEVMAQEGILDSADTIIQDGLGQILSELRRMPKISSMVDSMAPDEADELLREIVLSTLTSEGDDSGHTNL